MDRITISSWQERLIISGMLTFLPSRIQCSVAFGRDFWKKHVNLIFSFNANRLWLSVMITGPWLSTSCMQIINNHQIYSSNITTAAYPIYSGIQIAAALHVKLIYMSIFSDPFSLLYINILHTIQMYILFLLNAKTLRKSYRKQSYSPRRNPYQRKVLQ